MNAKQNRLWATMECKNRLMKEASEEEIKSKFFKEVLILEGKLTKVETELFEANADLRKLPTEDAEVLRVSGTSRVGLDGGRFQEPKTLKVMLDVQERPKEVLKGARGRFGRRASEGEQGSVSQCWVVAENEEGSGAKRVGRHAGVRTMPVGRQGRGHGREQGGVELHSQSGEQFDWMA